jgi:hypothetical protein
MKKWQEQNNTLPSYFLVDRTNNTVLAGFQNYNIPKWAWDLHGNENVPVGENNMFALASKSDITNPPPYLNNPNIDVTNPASWSDINKVKKYIKNLNEVKIQPSNINFTFPFWITKQNKSQAPFIADQLNKQGYTLNGRNGRKIEVEDITFNIPTILDYDSNYRDQPERKILNTYSPSSEVKIQPSPYKFPKIPFDKFKEILIEDMRETALELEFENPEEFINEFSDKLSQINDRTSLFEEIAGIYNEMGWGSDEFLSILNRIFIKDSVNEVKIQNPLVDLDQKIKDISNDINDQIEHIYFIGDDTNDLNDQMDNTARMYNWDYTTESLKNMSIKNKIELYRDLENLQAQFK